MTLPIAWCRTNHVTRSPFLPLHFPWCWLLCWAPYIHRMATAVPNPTFSLVHFPEGKTNGLFPGLLAKDSLLWLGHWLISKPITMVGGEDIIQWWLVFSICMCFAPEVHGLGVTKTYPWEISTHYYCHVLRAIYQTLPNILPTASHSYICSFRKLTEVLPWWPKIHGHHSQFRKECIMR